MERAHVIGGDDPVAVLAAFRVLAFGGPDAGIAPAALPDDPEEAARRAPVPPAGDPEGLREVAARTLDLLGRYAGGAIGPEVYNGTPVELHEYPECVAVGGRPSGWCCSGVLIARNAVLTASHCFRTECLNDSRLSGPASGLWVYFGRGGADPGTTVKVLRFYKYDRPLPEGVRNDLAVLILENSVDVAPATFAPGDAIDTAEDVVITGFGLDENAEAGTKQKGRVSMASTACALPADRVNYGCGETYEFVASDTVAPKPPPGPVDTCDGDSGGPAYLQDDGSDDRTLAGITSRGVRGSQPGQCGRGGIYTRIDRPEYQKWLRERVPGILW